MFDINPSLGTIYLNCTNRIEGEFGWLRFSPPGGARACCARGMGLDFGRKICILVRLFTSMRRQFLLRLSAYIFAAFLLTAGLVYFQFTARLEDRAEQMIKTRLNDMLDFMLHVERAVSSLNRVNNASTTDRANALAEIISLNPDVLHNQEQLQGICNRLGAEQIAITDADGIIEAAVPDSLVGRNLADGESMIPIVSLSDRGNEILAEVSDISRGSMQFANVKRQDGPGRVRLGFRTRLEQQARAESSLDNTPLKLRLGKDGLIIIFRRGVCLTHERPVVSETELLALEPGRVHMVHADNMDFYAYAVDANGYRLVGVLPAQEVYGAGWRTVKVMVTSNLLLFMLIFGVVSWLLQRIVLRGIFQVNETLMEITEGDLERKVDVTTCPEFVRLSNGINFMVDSLRSVGEERQSHVKRDLELARTIQNTVLPNKFPAFPNVEQFDLYATCIQASEVGGDFYDFSMPDKKHLHFLVADVDASGIAAALFMMRAMTIIRTLTRAGGTPQSIVSETNRELCQGNQTGIHMALFYGKLDITTGLLEFVNAGRLHSLHQTSSDRYDLLTPHADYVLGDQTDTQFHTETRQLAPGDRLFLYTEGVLNATNTNNIPFSEARLKYVLHDNLPTVTDVLQGVRSSLRQYLDGERMERDVTMLALEYLGEPTKEMMFDFTTGQVEEAASHVTRLMEEFLVAPADITALQDALRTIVRVLPVSTPVRLKFGCTRQRAEMQLHFPAPQYNPLEHSHVVAMDESLYNFTDNQGNIVQLCKNLI